MGKYMKKAKEKDDVVVREVVQPASSLGVWTRARTLALQRGEAAAAVAEAGEDGGLSYLELRSRRLEKPAALCGSKRRKDPSSKESNSNSDSKLRGGNLRKKIKIEEEEEEEKEEETEERNLQKKVGEIVEESREEDDEKEEMEKKIDEDDGFVGENCLAEFDVRERTRESTPCHLITDPEKIRTPGSSTKHPDSSEANSRPLMLNPMLRDIPSTQEMNEFFSSQEEQQRKRFMDKYNFDPVNDKPLPGCFEWVKVDRK